MRLVAFFTALLLVGPSSILAAPVITITSPLDEANSNPTGGANDPVDVTYQVTGNTCTGVKSTFAIVPYVNGVAVSCAGSGCSCDGTSESCNNITKTITLDGNSFSGCLNTIRLEMNPRPFCGPLCFTPCSSQILSNNIQVWQTAQKTCAPPAGCNRPTVGKPVDVASGKMYHEWSDLRIQGPLSLEFVRRYDSQSTYNGPMGFGWQHDFLMRLESGGTGQEVFVDREARRVYFAQTVGGSWDENRVDHLVLTQPGSPPWRVTDKHQMKYEFDGAGKLTRIADRNNNALTMTYTGSNLTTITDPLGRALTLTYDGSNRVQTISAGGRTVTYTYTSGNLTRVDFSDAAFLTYEYTDPTDSHNLTAARDGLSHLIENHTYDTSDRVTHTEADGGNYAYTIAYDSPTQTTVTNSLVVNTVYTHNSFSGLVTASTGPGCTSCGGGTNATLTYDDYQNLTDRVDGRGIQTHMTYDGKGNALTRQEAVGTPVQRTWTYTYHPTFNFPATVTIPSVGTCSNPNKVVTNTYDGTTGDLTQEQITGCNGNSTFTYTTTYTYDTHGQLRTVNGPRTDVTDLTTYDYYLDGDGNLNRRGRLQRATNALSQQANYNGYDLYGNVGSVIDPNNVETTHTYDGHDRILETRIHGAIPADDIVTENHYDLAGNLDFVRLPRCFEEGMSCAFSLDYNYDGVNRLTQIDDRVGNKVVYAYDTEGNRTREENHDVSSVIQRFTNFKYDSFNRLQYVYFNATVPENVGSIFSKYTYDGDHNRLTNRDPEGHTTTFTYDELNRLKTVTQTAGPDTLLTTYGYDIQDNLASVQDPNTLPTTYGNSDMGWRLTVASPDTGTTTNGFDPAGNLLTTLNANGVTATRTYDALNRPTTVTYPDSSLNVAYSYDSPSVTFGIGRRTGMTDPSGTSTYFYDRRGLETREDKVIGSTTYTTQYAFDKNGNPTQVLYPTSDAILRQGQANFGLDNADRVTSVTAKVNGASTSVASGIQYKPFGPHTQLTFGNGLGDSRSYDSRYQIGTWTLGSLLNYAHVFNDDGNLTSRADSLNTANNRTFSYDGAHRLTQAAGPWGTGTACSGAATYTYDRNGNRLCKGEGSPATNYVFGAVTNRLASSSGGEIATYSYDSNGNTTGDGSHTYQYSQADRLATVDSGTTGTYTYDGNGRRVIKTASGVTTYFLYDPAGRLLTETSTSTATGKDYVYFQDAPLGRVDWSTEQTLGNLLSVNKGSPNVNLDWTTYPSGSNQYVVRRKQVVNPNDKTFNGAVAIVTVSDPTKTYDDPVLGDANRYDYEVFRRFASDTLYFYHTDHLGTPIAMTSASTALVWRAERLPFGGIHSLGVPTVANNLGFPGQYLDGETGLHQNRYRDYDARSGRFAESDPIGLQSGPNPFTYVGANPTRFADALGLCKVDVRFSKLGPGYYHAYIVLTSPDGSRAYYRGGPKGPGPSSGSSGALSSGSGGSSSQSCCGSSQSDSSGSSNGSSPGSSPGGAGSNNGPYGPIVVNWGPYIPGTVDWEEGTPPSSTLADNRFSCQCISRCLQNNLSQIERASIPYNPFSTNSNAAVFEVLGNCGLRPPSEPPVWAPGWTTDLIP